MQQTKTGKLRATGADMEVNLGFLPDYIQVTNKSVLQTGSAEADIGLEWFRGMPLSAGHSIKSNVAIPYDNGTAAAETKDANKEFITTGGLEILDKSSISDPGGTPDGPVTVIGVVGFKIPAAFHSAATSISGEDVGAAATDYSGATARGNIVPGTVVFDSDGTPTDTLEDSNNDGVLVATTGTGSGVIDYETGEYTLTVATSSTAANFDYDYDDELYFTATRY